MVTLGVNCQGVKQELKVELTVLSTEDIGSQKVP